MNFYPSFPHLLFDAGENLNKRVEYFTARLFFSSLPQIDGEKGRFFLQNQIKCLLHLYRKPCDTEKVKKRLGILLSTMSWSISSAKEKNLLKVFDF
jgi:hypothetical protein